MSARGKPFRLPRFARFALLVCLAAAGVAQWSGFRLLPGGVVAPTATTFCRSPRVLDGDTLDCGGRRIRLYGIDAPELPGHCRPGRDCTPGDPFASQARLRSLTRGEVACGEVDVDVYGRSVARCTGPEGDLSCAMLESGHAVRRYGALLCL